MKNKKGNDLISTVVLVVDLIMLNSLLWLSQLIFNKTMPDIFVSDRMSFFTASLAFVIASFVFPAVVHYRRLTLSNILKRNFLLVFGSMFAFCVGLHAFGYHNVIVFGVKFSVLFYVVVIIARCLERSVLNYLRSSGHNTRSVLFIGNDPANLLMYQSMKDVPSTGYRVVGYYSNGIIEDAPAEFQKIGDREDFRKIMRGETSLPKNVDEIYCSLSHSESDEMRDIIRFCDHNVIHFYYVPRIYNNLQLSLHAELFDNQVVFTNHHEPLQELSNRFVKRMFDIIVSLLALICLLPFLPIVAFIIKKQSPDGPIFFSQERTGLNGENFVCYKFRSMHVNADADKIQATKDDPRKFAFGNFMRKANIDEFPQFWNVLKGDMSVVGPRPHMVYHTEKYSALIDKYMVRHFSKPGITGYAQVTGFRGETEELWQMEGRIKKDIWYIEHWSLWLDIKIVFLTAWSIIHHDKNAY